MTEVKVELLMGLSVANAAERPRWNAGDVFAHFVKRPFR